MDSGGWSKEEMLNDQTEELVVKWEQRIKRLKKAKGVHTPAIIGAIQTCIDEMKEHFIVENDEDSCGMF